MRNPMQPIQKDEHGILRFKENEIVRRLLDDSGISLNEIAFWDVSREDREQFAQLIGYSLSGFSDLSYVSDETCDVATQMAGSGMSEQEARIAALEDRLGIGRKHVREMAAALFQIHPDDLVE